MAVNRRGPDDIHARFAGEGEIPGDAALKSLRRMWWAVGLRGLAAVGFGVLTLLLPGAGLATLVLLFGAYALLEGICNVLAALRWRAGMGRPWWALLLEGLVSIAAGLVALVNPGLTAVALVYVIAAWAIVTGLFEIFEALRLRKHITNEGWLIAGGVLSVAFGALMMRSPGAGALVMTVWIGAYAVVFGVMLIALALRLRRWGTEAHQRMAHAA